MANAIDIVVNATDRASGELRGINKALSSMTKTAERAGGVIASAMGIGAGALGAIAVAGAKHNSTLEQSEARWTTLLKSSQEAEKQMAWMKDFAKTTPFDYKSIDQSATAMMGMGLGIKEVNKWLPTLGDASAVLGGGSETVQGLAMALGQMNAKGKVSAEEMQQLAERGVNAWQMLADGMGLPQAEVRKLSEEGKLLASDALPLIYQGMQETFGGGTQNLMKSTTGQAMLARENFNTLAGTLTKGAFEWFGANILPMINNGLEWLNSTFQGGLIQGFQNIAGGSTKTQIALVALAGIILGTLVGAITLLVTTFGGAIVAFSGFVAAGMAVAGLAMLIWKNWQPIKAFFQNTFGEIFNSAKKLFMGLWTMIQPALSAVVSFVSQKLAQMKAFWDSNGAMILQAVQNVWGFISGFISGVLNVILGIFKFIFPAIQFIVQGVWQNIKGLINGALNFIMGLVKTFSALFTGNWSALWAGVKQMFSGAIQFIWNYVQLFFGAKILGVLGKFAGKAFGFIKSFASKAGNSIAQFASKVWNAFTSMVSKVLSKISSWVSGMVSKVGNFVYRILSKITRFNTDLGLLFTRGWEAVKRIVKKGLDMAVDAVKGMFRTFLNAGKGLLEAFKEGIKKGLNKAIGAVKDGMKKIRDFLPFSPAKKGALADLDKSGKSFFPTFAKGMGKGTGAMLSMANRGLGELNSMLAEPAQRMEQLDGFSFGRRNDRLTIAFEVGGEVNFNGERTRVSESTTIQETTGSIHEIVDGLRQAIRKR
ncbi:tape measure protein [Bacillus paralicheniformis]|uniref:tape measure protein n=1 Tax=Bacillus paralicheniformis TaxID=1648923 RepID=UPI002DBB1207|nr:tape measure protein [Bacillus paralicheniformis]MEC1866740.1 tape measure protein [Bacillus paralicheniformis]